MKLVTSVDLVALVALAVGYYAGTWAGDRRRGLDTSMANGLEAAMEKMSRALERLETRVGRGPLLAARPDRSPADPDQTKLVQMLAGIVQRLDRLNVGGPPESSRERGPEQDERLRSLQEGEPEGIRRQHYMWTGRDLLERYGLPDHAQHWTGMTVRWVYFLNRAEPSASPRAVFELTDDYVTAALLERGS